MVPINCNYRLPHKSYILQNKCHLHQKKQVFPPHQYKMWPWRSPFECSRMIHVQPVSALSVFPPCKTHKYTSHSHVLHLYHADFKRVLPTNFSGKLISHTLCMHITPTWLKRLLLNKCHVSNSAYKVPAFPKISLFQQYFPRILNWFSVRNRKQMSKLQSP